MSFSNRLVKYGTHGAITYGALYYISGGATKVEVMGQRYPLVAVGFGLGVASSLVNDFAHTWVLPMLPQDDKLKSFEGTAVSLASGAASVLAFAYLLNPAMIQEIGTMKLALVGMASEVAGQWTYEQIAPMVGIKQGDLLM